MLQEKSENSLEDNLAMMLASDNPEDYRMANEILEAQEKIFDKLKIKNKLVSMGWEPMFFGYMSSKYNMLHNREIVKSNKIQDIRIIYL